MIYCACGCGQRRPERDKDGRLRQFINGHCNTGHFKKGIKRPGEQCPSWKGGRRKDSLGYVLIWKPDHPHATLKGNVLEHRLIMEKCLGRYLLPSESVHHVNHDKADNRIENLQLMKTDEHTRHHVLQRPMIERKYWGKNMKLR